MNKVVSVSQFIEYINDALRTFEKVKVKGEVTDFSINRNKWVSFDLKDEEDEQILPCFTSYSLFKSQNIEDVLEDGMRVEVRGQVKVRQKGHFSMFTKEINLVGEGTLQKAFEKLKKKLEEEGFFSDDRKREIPRFPQKIGLITSPEAKAYTDFKKVLRQRMGGINIIHYPVHVQGESAVAEIEQAFEYFNNEFEDLDLIVLTRGGGSLEDLKAFNSEKVAKSVFSSEFPVVCGVGHQDDETLAGYTADLRASTPSNAAELIVEEREKVLHQIKSNLQIIKRKLERKLKNKKEIISDFNKASSNFIRSKKQNYETTVLKLQHCIENYLTNIKKDLKLIKDSKSNIVKGIERIIEKNKAEVQSKVDLLESYSPKSVLKRGYSIAKDKNGNIIKNSNQLKVDDNVTVKLSKGKFKSSIKEIIN
ncbi:MAG: exodeoxyribonuclease VII large subunit [Candidatus Magasanikbacteria bacterium]